MSSLEKWHFKKEISFSNLLTTIVGLLAIIGWVFTLQADVQVLKVRQDNTETGMVSLGSDMQSLEILIIQRLDSFGDRQYDHLSRQHSSSGEQ